MISVHNQNYKPLSWYYSTNRSLHISSDCAGANSVTVGYNQAYYVRTWCAPMLITLVLEGLWIFVKSFGSIIVRNASTSGLASWLASRRSAYCVEGSIIGPFPHEFLRLWLHLSPNPNARLLRLVQCSCDPVGYKEHGLPQWICPALLWTLPATLPEPRAGMAGYGRESGVNAPDGAVLAEPPSSTSSTTAKPVSDESAKNMAFSLLLLKAELWTRTWAPMRQLTPLAMIDSQ